MFTERYYYINYLVLYQAFHFSFHLSQTWKAGGKKDGSKVEPEPFAKGVFFSMILDIISNPITSGLYVVEMK